MRGWTVLRWKLPSRGFLSPFSTSRGNMASLAMELLVAKLAAHPSKTYPTMEFWVMNVGTSMQDMLARTMPEVTGFMPRWGVSYTRTEPLQQGPDRVFRTSR